MSAEAAGDSRSPLSSRGGMRGDILEIRALDDEVAKSEGQSMTSFPLKDTTDHKGQGDSQGTPPSVPVRELARRRVSDAFSGYNAIDMHDDAAAIAKRRNLDTGEALDVFDPTTFKMYTPALDVDALCTELMEVAGEVLSNPTELVRIVSDGALGDDEDEKLAKQRIHRQTKRSLGGSAADLMSLHTFPVFSAAAATSGTVSPLESKGSLASSSSLALKGSSHRLPVKTSSMRGESRRSVAATGPPPSKRTSESANETAAHPRGTAPQLQKLSPVSPADQLLGIYGAGSQLMSQARKDEIALRKQRNQLLLQGLRNGDLNAEFVRSVQELKHMGDAVAAINSYYAQGRNVTHQDALSKKKRNYHAHSTGDEQGGTTESRASISHTTVRPLSGRAASPTLLRAGRVQFEADGERSATPPSGVHERKVMLQRILDQRRDSEIRRLNERQRDAPTHGAPSALTRSRSLRRLNSISGHQPTGLRRRSSCLGGAEDALVPLATLSSRWRTMLQASAPSRPITSNAGNADDSFSSVPPDVCCLFFRDVQGHQLTTYEIMSSSARFLGTISYVYFFPTDREEAAKLCEGGVLADDRAALFESQACEMVDSVVEEDATLDRNVLVAGGGVADDMTLVHQQRDRVQTKYFPIAHRYLRQALKLTNGRDCPRGAAGLLFFSSVGSFGLNAGFFEANGRRVLLSRCYPPGATSAHQATVRSTAASSEGALLLAGESLNDVQQIRDGNYLKSPSMGKRESSNLSSDSPTSFAMGHSGRSRTPRDTSSISTYSPHATQYAAQIEKEGAMGVPGAHNHFDRIARNRQSVQLYPPKPPSFELVKKHAATCSLPQRFGAPTTRGSDFPIVKVEGLERFPPPGLDVAEGVPVDHPPRLFESLPRTPRPPSQISRMKRWNASQSKSSCSASLPTFSGHRESPSGRAIHQLQLLPTKVLSVSQQQHHPNFNAPSSSSPQCAEDGTAAKLFPLLCCAVPHLDTSISSPERDASCADGSQLQLTQLYDAQHSFSTAVAVCSDRRSPDIIVTRRLLPSRDGAVTTTRGHR